MTNPFEVARSGTGSNGTDAAPRPAPAPRKKIRVLILEDRPVDAELVLMELQRSGFEVDAQRVETETEFVGRLDPTIDVILADYRLPQFDGLRALRRLQQQPQLDIPFIIVSGALGDELAAQCIKQGVTDYLLKDRLERLGLAVSNALDERRLRAERKQVEEQLRHSQKMETVGQLAGGIAHDFNNMLTVINGHAGLLLDKGGLPQEVADSLKQIYMAGERASNLTRQLLFFSRKRPIQRHSLELNLIVEEVGAMLRRLIGEDITLDIKLDPVLPAVEADGGMVEQVLTNLVVNARDAMSHGGLIKIHTQAVDRSAGDIPAKCAAQPGRYACIMVQDTGSGIPPEVAGRIFEPFFTTKEEGKGTGLGLATVFGIVQQHGGWIEVESQIGAGTTFSVYFPATAGSAPLPKPEDAGTKVKGGRETILVVEDEAGVREFAVAVLRLYGYRVLQACSGVDALEVWLRHSSRIDLVLTDMVMPETLSGPELSQRLRAERPGLPVIFTSGYSQKLASQVFGPNSGAQFIHKPYQPRALAKIVRETLDAQHNAVKAGSGEVVQ